MISDKIEYIDLVLENCDYYRIYAEDVHSLILNDIYKDVMVNIVGQYLEYEIAGYANIKLFNRDFKTIWQNKYDLDVEQNFTERMMIKDITSVVIAGKDQDGNIEEHQFYVMYKEESEGELGSSNLWQANMFTEDHISIEIKDWDKK